MVNYSDWEAGKKVFNFTFTGNSYFDSVKRKRFVEVLCKCGVIKFIRYDGIQRGLSTSCGCLVKERLKRDKPATTHGLSNHRIYYIYNGMLARCYNKKSKKYYCYGQIGVRVFQEWIDSFQAFYDWSIANGYREDLTIDRYPNKRGNYEPTNCRWATEKQQNRNKNNNIIISAFGEEKCVIEWCEDDRCVVNDTALLKRLKRGWDAELAITKPLRDNGYKK